MLQISHNKTRQGRFPMTIPRQTVSLPGYYIRQMADLVRLLLRPGGGIVDVSAAAT